MADVAVAPRSIAAGADQKGRRAALLVLAAVAAAGAALYLTGSLNGGSVTTFIVIFLGLMVGAIPLVMIGALAAAIIGTFVPASAFERIGRLPEPIQIPAAAAAGFAFPICECGSIPVARRLIDRGLLPSAAVTFMLAAPIVNPIVVLSTYIAYRGRDVLVPMVLGRVGLGLIAAMIVGWVVGARDRASFLRPMDAASETMCGCSTDAGSCCGPEEDGHDHGPRSRRASFFGYFAADIAYMGRFLVIGAAVAALLQTAVPQSVLAGVAGIPLISLVAMMALAFALSLCSESDAFVAASFVQFGVGSQLAFLVFGPMMDAKLAFMYRATFSKGFLRTVLAVVATVTLVGTLWIEVAFG